MRCSEPLRGVTTNCVMHPVHVYEVRPRKDKRGVDLISDALPFAFTIPLATVIETHEHAASSKSGKPLVSSHFKAAFPSRPFSLDGK